MKVTVNRRIAEPPRMVSDKEHTEIGHGLWSFRSSSSAVEQGSPHRAAVAPGAASRGLHRSRGPGEYA